MRNRCVSRARFALNISNFVSVLDHAVTLVLGILAFPCRSLWRRRSRCGFHTIASERELDVMFNIILETAIADFQRFS